MLSSRIAKGEITVIMEGNLCAFDNEAQKEAVYTAAAEQKTAKIVLYS